MKAGLRSSVLSFRFLKFIVCVTLLFTFYFLLLTLSPAEEKTVSIEEIIVTATKIGEPKQDVPASIQIITQEDIKNYYPMPGRTFMAGIKWVF